MNVWDVMTKNPITIDQDATLRAALETMGRVHCHHLPVISQHGNLIGILTAHDCRHALNLPSIVGRRYWEENKLLDHLLVSAVMTLVPITVDENLEAEDAIDMMLDKHIGCLLIMRGKDLVGIVTTTDILRSFAKLLRELPKSERIKMGADSER